MKFIYWFFIYWFFTFQFFGVRWKWKRGHEWTTLLGRLAATGCGGRCRSSKQRRCGRIRSSSGLSECSWRSPDEWERRHWIQRGPLGRTCVTIWCKCKQLAYDVDGKKRTQRVIFFRPASILAAQRLNLK